MEFVVIKNSESQTGYDIEDARYVGPIRGTYCGYQFEVIKNGQIGYFSVTYFPGTPEECVSEYCTPEEYFADHGCEPTGRVVFRGYYRASWDRYSYEYDEPSYVRDVKTEEAIKRYVI